MTKEDFMNGYQTEIQYQRRMLSNLSRWFRLFLILSSIGWGIGYSFSQTNRILAFVGFVLATISILFMLLFGYGIYKGKINLKKVIDDFETKLGYSLS